MKKHIIFFLALFAALWTGSGAHAAIIVGRISYLEGPVYRYMDVDNSWADTFMDSPAGTGDIMATGEMGRAEIAFPNEMLVRLDSSTEIEILNLEEDTASFFLHSGTARFYSRNPGGSLEIETARGTARVAPGSVIDLQSGSGSVTVAAVHGQATFYSLQNDEEREDVIANSSRVEFREGSLVVGRGSIKREWDRWCAQREGTWTQNRLVHSEYLPETMQEYAYTLEPYGSWSRIYYRGYYYWGWKPYAVAADWGPYTTGYWYEWQGSPVWIDQNPWGWVTHHHGHWINMHGAWMWTPYVQVSSVSGVTVTGFNITFGRTYRPYWHPGRVRWIAYSEYVGWLPLAPWETYYGCRGWEPRSVVVAGGSGFSINVNLQHHSYIDHAVIIPKRDLHRRGPGMANSYNSVKIRNINKTTIVNNYKPIPTVRDERSVKHATKVADPGDTVRETFAQKTSPRIGIQERRGAPGIPERKTKQQERKVQNSQQSSPRAAVVRPDTVTVSPAREKVQKKRAVAAGSGKKPEMAEPRVEKRTGAGKEKVPAQNVAPDVKPQKNLARQERVQEKNKESRQARVSTTSGPRAIAETPPVPVKRNGASVSSQGGQELALAKKQDERPSRLTSRESGRKDLEKEAFGKNAPDRPAAGYRNESMAANTLRDSRETEKRSRRELAAAAPGSRRFR